MERLQQDADGLKLDRDGLLRDISRMKGAMEDLKATSEYHWRFYAAFCFA